MAKEGVAGVDDEHVAADGEDSGHAVDGEDEVGGLDGGDDREQRVATRLPASLTKKCGPAYSSLTGMTLRSSRTATLFPGSKLSSSP